MQISRHIIFLIRPFHRRLARAILKEPKASFYDTGYIKGDAEARLENACAADWLATLDA